MNNKAHLRPKDFDSNGDIIPMACKEENDMIPVGTTVHINPKDIKWECNGGDLINRDALKRALHNFFDGKVIDEPTYILRDVFCYIDGAPAVDISGSEYFPYRTAYFNGVEDGRATARPQGEWIISEYVDTRRGFITKCPFCKTDTIGGGNFCPNCGADMRGGADNEHL